MIPARKPESPGSNDETALALELIERIIRECPRRKPTSEDELRAQQMVERELARLGLETEWHTFKYNDSLYANLVLHFGLGVLGTLFAFFAPLAALFLHLIPAISFFADSTRRFCSLRRFLGFKPSQNLIATLPSQGRPSLRVVIMAHADAALTGLLFRPQLVRRLLVGRLPTFLKRSLAVSTFALFALAGVDLLALLTHFGGWPLAIVEGLLSIPPLLAFLFNLEIVLRNQIVPGANDDLSAVAALTVLASRFASSKPREVELVFAVTGCEEASMGGSLALARDWKPRWRNRETVVLALDSLGGGDLRYFTQEGDVVGMPVQPWILKTMSEVAASHPRFARVAPFESPVGGTDADPFLAHGYQAGSLVGIDPIQGTPTNYHLPSDTPENLDLEKLMAAVDFAEELLLALFCRAGYVLS